MEYLLCLQELRESAPEFVNYIFVFLSEGLLKLFFVLGGVIYWSFSKRTGATMLLGYSVTCSFNQTLKNIMCVYRPWVKNSSLYVHPLAQKGATGYSFPSGHTTTATYFLGSIISWQRKKKSVCILCSILILLVAFSRNWLGAHTFADVSAALIDTCVFICLINLFVYWFGKHQNLDWLIVIIAVTLSIAVLLFLQFKSYPIDYAADGTLLADPYLMLTDCYSACGLTCGAFIGWFIERHFIKFEDTENTKNRILRSIIGIVTSLILLVCSGLILKNLDRNIAHLIKYFVLFFYMITICPLIFKKFKLD